MREEIFKLTDEISSKAFKDKSFEKTRKLVTKYSILMDFNQGVLNVCNTDLFRKYEELYVPAIVNNINKYDKQAKSHVEESSDLIHNFTAFLNNKVQNNKIFALFGDLGSGKSLVTQKIFDDLWRNFVAKNRSIFTDGLGFDENSWFPFYLDMSMFNGDITKAFIEVALNKQYTLSYQQIEYLKKHCRCLIILDHFELVKSIRNPSLDYASILQEWCKSKFFITCRSDILGIEDFNKYFDGLQVKNNCIVHYYLNKFSTALLCKTVVDNWFDANYYYIKQSLDEYNLFFKCNLQFTTYDTMFNWFLNYMMQMAFYVYSDDKLIISLTELNSSQEDPVAQGGLFWKLCLINWQLNNINLFSTTVNRQNCSDSQCFFSINYANKNYFINMQKSFRNYFVAMCLWRNLINNCLEEFINRLSCRNLTEESGVIDYLVDFFDKLKDSEKNNLQTLIRTALISVDKTDVNVFAGLNAILKEFDLVNDCPLVAKPDPPKSDDSQEKPVLFSYSAVSFSSTEPELKQQNKVNLICSAHEFSLLCFELYSPTRKTMRTYYVKLAEEEANVVLKNNSPNVKDFKKTDIVDLFAGTSQDVPEARKENIKKLFLNKSRLLFV